MRRRGFTLVELLVVIAIIGVLVALLLPAIQAAREAARRRQCTNNVKQMALGFMNHESAYRYLPTGGWGYRWVGDPDAGYGKKQPGSWCYNILAFIEQVQLRNYGKGITDPVQKEAALMITVQALLPIFNCPSKRPLALYPFEDDGGNPYMAENLKTCNEANNCRVMRNDYRVNAGNTAPGDQEGPKLTDNPDTWTGWTGSPNSQSGICFQRSLIRFKDIVDGTSNTAMVGERCLDPRYYENGVGGLDDQCIFIGHDRDNVGYTGSSEQLVPKIDAEFVNGNNGADYRFGSAHVGAFNVAMADGSVQTIGYEIDPDVWFLYGGRDDGR